MKTMKARDLMTRYVLTVTESMQVAELASFFTENEITGAAVKNAQGKLVGVVSLSDLAMHASKRDDIVRSEFNPDFYVRGWEEIYNREEVAGLHVEQMDVLIRDVMNPAVYSVTEDTQIAEIAQRMLELRIHRMFVMRGDELTGIVSTTDFLRLFVDEPPAVMADPGSDAESVRWAGSAEVPS